MDDALPTPDGPVERIRAAWRTHVNNDEVLVDRLLTRHREKHRRYHVAAHVDAVVQHVEHLAATEDVADVGAVVAAAMYHDAIYEPESPANERASARLARRDLASLGWQEARTDAVGTMIEGTAQHLGPPDTDTAVLFDADLAILAATDVDYDAYATAVRAEYRHVADDDWLAGRRLVLQSFIDRPHIFATPTARATWEASARRNLERELSQLGDEGA